LSSLAERSRAVKSLLRDRDKRFTANFDEVFHTEGIRVIKTLPRKPRANAFAECFVGSVCRECLDRRPIFNRRHLGQVLTEYLTHYNGHRPHRALDQWAPKTSGREPVPIDKPDAIQLRRNEILGGLIKEYRLVV
jgi:transposase InsO family protein